MYSSETVLGYWDTAEIFFLASGGLAEPLDATGRTLRFCGTPVEKHCPIMLITASLTVCGLMTRWVWSEAGAQPHVEEALSIGGFGYPVSIRVLFIFAVCSIIVD